MCSNCALRCAGEAPLASVRCAFALGEQSTLCNSLATVVPVGRMPGRRQLGGKRPQRTAPGVRKPLPGQSAKPDLSSRHPRRIVMGLNPVICAARCLPPCPNTQGFEGREPTPLRRVQAADKQVDLKG